MFSLSFVFEVLFLFDIQVLFDSQLKYLIQINIFWYQKMYSLFEELIQGFRIDLENWHLL